MKISAINNFRINRETKNQKAQNPRFSVLGADTVSFGARIPSRDDIYFPQFSKDELKYKTLFTEGRNVNWNKLGDLTSDEGIELLSKLKDDKTVSDKFKKAILLGEKGNYCIGVHAQKTTVGNKKEQARHFRYIFAMLNAAPDKKTAKKLLSDTTFTEKPGYGADVIYNFVNYDYFRALVKETDRLGLLDEVIFSKKNYVETAKEWSPLFEMLGTTRQEDIMNIASPQTRERILSNKGMIFKSGKALLNLLNLASDDETKLQILTAATPTNENLLHFSDSVDVCLEEFRRIERNALARTKDSKEAHDIRAHFGQIRKNLLLQKNFYGRIPISMHPERNTVFELLDASPDKETYREQLGHILYITDKKSKGHISSSDVIRRIRSQEELNIFLNTTVHNYIKQVSPYRQVKYWSCPIKACLDLDQILEVLNKFDSSKAKLDFLLDYYSFESTKGRREGMYDNIRERVECIKESPNLKKVLQVYWNKILEIISNDDVTPDEAIKLLNKYQFIVPQDEKDYYDGIVKSLSQ